MAGEHFPLDSKPFDVAVRPFHRINGPNYDKAVDTDGARRGAKQPPSGLAKESGARGPEAFKDSGFLENVTKLLGKLLKPLLAVIPLVGPVILAVNAFLAKVTGKDPINELIKALGKLISAGVEGALFARYMRSIPAWVPVGRKGYASSFTYREDGADRTVSAEEEREIEGFLAGSYQLSNDIVFTQWSHFRHWAFQVLPHPGYRYLIGQGNVVDPEETAFINQIESRSNQPKFRPVLNIYGQNPSGRSSPEAGAIECLIDVGAISKPIGDRGTHGVMFDPSWPYWPMTGDYFWAAGRWSYDCMRASLRGDVELFPTQLNPLKALATARFEGFKFAENAGTVPAVRFFFFATSEGGYTEFRTSTDRNKVRHDSGITLGDRDYEFIVDLPPHEEGRSPYPVGSTINFALNRLVIRPRLLISIRQAPFAVGGSQPAFADGLEFVAVEPKIELLRPAKPTERPSQVRVTIPLSKVKPANPEAQQAVGLDIALGWHDPVGADTAKLFRVTADIRMPAFFGDSGPVRFVTAINGRWNLLAESVPKASGEPGPSLPEPPTPRTVHRAVMFLPADAPVSVISSGTWFHGFGEFMENDTQAGRRLFVGGILLNVDNDTKRRIKGFIDDAKKTIDDIKKAGQAIKKPKEEIRRQLKAKIAEERKKGGDPKAWDKLEKEVDGMVDGLPDTPAGMQAAIDDLSKRLGEITDALDAIEDFFKITDDLIGERFFPGWHEDIDAAVKTGLEESKRVSAIARTMFLHPTPVVNRHDEPMGWAELIDPVRTPIGRDPIGFVVTGINRDTTRLTVGNLFDFQQSGRQSPMRIRMAARRFSTVGSGNNLAEQVNHPSDRTDYDLELRITIEKLGPSSLPPV